MQKRGEEMNRVCDLHTHSVFSDGTCTPTEIIVAAAELGLSAVALSDHNTVDGLPEFLSAAKDAEVEAVAGAEFSVDYNGKELHLLGLYLPETAFADISALMKEVNARKEASNLALVDSLGRAGYSLDYSVMVGRTPAGKINRAHIAAELTAKGYTASIKEAFDTLLSKTGGHYVEPKRLTVWEMIRFIRDIGAVPVLAHPFLNLDEAELTAFLPSAKEQGLLGMECCYSLYSEEETEKSRTIADAFGLAPSGGSDFHGTNKPDIRLGSGKGNLAVPHAWAVALRELR